MDKCAVLCLAAAALCVCAAAQEPVGSEWAALQLQQGIAKLQESVAADDLEPLRAAVNEVEPDRWLGSPGTVTMVREHSAAATLAVAEALASAEPEQRRRGARVLEVLVRPMELQDATYKPVEATMVLLALNHIHDDDGTVRHLLAKAIGQAVAEDTRASSWPTRPHMDLALRQMAIEALRDAALDPDPTVSETARVYLHYAREGAEAGTEVWAVALNVFSEIVGSGEPLPVVLAMAYSGEPTFWEGPYEVRFHIATEEGRWVGPREGEGPGGAEPSWLARAREITVGNDTMLMVPALRLTPGLCHTQIINDALADFAPLPAGTYRVRAIVEVRPHREQEVFIRPELEPDAWTPWGTAIGVLEVESNEVIVHVR